jgi:aspartate racemase
MNGPRGVWKVQIGLIGGIGPAATDFYYRRLISTFSNEKTPLELTIVHADAPTLLGNLASNHVASQVAIYMKLTNRLAVVGAGCVAVTSIAGHFCIDAFKASSPLPVVDLIFEVNKAIEKSGYKRIGILGTRTVMETQFYGAISGATVIPPGGRDLDDVHQAYVTMATSGVVTNAQRDVFAGVSQRLLKDAGAQAIMLGGADLALVFDERDAPFPIVDCAAIHADAIVRFATS